MFPLLVSDPENGYKAELRKPTTTCCGFMPCKITIYVVFLTFEKVYVPQGMKNPRFWDRGGSYKSVVLVCLH